MTDTAGPPMDHAVSVRGLRHSYASGRSQAPRAALDGIDFEVKVGELFGLLGPNGGGKTTFCRILTTALVPSGGHAEVLGADVAAEPARVRRGIGVVFQSPSLDRKLSVRENLLHQGRLYGLRGRDLEERIASMLARFGLSERPEERVETLSGGLKRRAELAKSLLHRPRVLILDEPSTGLDPGARSELWRHLREMRQDGVTILAATHLMDEAEKCDRLAILDQGRLVALGTPEGLKGEIGGDVVTIQAQDPEGLKGLVRSRFHLEASVIDGTLRLEKPEGHAFIPSLVEAFPGRISTVTLSKPTLEDVFIHRTSHRFWREGGS